MLTTAAFLFALVTVPPDSGQYTRSGVWYAVRGSGEPVVLVHGANLDARSMEPLAERLARTHRVIVTDLRYHGRTRDGSGPFSFHDDVIEVLDAVGVARATIIGHSLGGAVAIDLALAAPSRAARLVLIAPSVSGKPATRPIAGFDAVREAVLAKDWSKAGSALAATPVMRLVHDTSQQASIAAIVADNTRLFLADRSRVRPGIAAADRLHELSLPVLVVLGSQDPTEAGEAGALIVQRVRGARAETIAGCGHLLPFDCRDQTAARVSAFLSQGTTR